MAGSGENYRPVGNEDNKTFLKIGGKTILQIMLSELHQVPGIDRICICGPKTRLEHLLEQIDPVPSQKPIRVFEQGHDLIDNMMHVLEATSLGVESDRVVLILSSDIPLVTAREVRQFIDRCDMDRYDYIAGVTTEEALRRFYPTESKPGVVMTYFYFKEGHYRINNMQMARPSAVTKANYIRKTYAIRYQKEWRNILKMVLGLILTVFTSPAAVFIYLKMQVSRIAHERNYQTLAAFLRRHSPRYKVENLISRLLGTRFGMVVTDFGGSAVDVDNDRDYEAICQRYAEWREMLYNHDQAKKAGA